MTPARRRGSRSHGRGTLELDKRFPGLGRLKRASGTNDPKVYRMLVGMLETLQDKGRLDILRAIRDGQLAPLEVWEHYRAGTLEQAPNPETLKPFKKAALAWARHYRGRQGEGISDRHRYELTQKLTHVAAMGPTGSPVADLPRLLQAYREQCQETGTHRVFNYAKAACLAFLRSVYGRASAVYRAVAGVEGLRVIPQRQGNPQAPDAARAIRDRLPAAAGRIWWTMCATGMGPDELWQGKWRVEGDRVMILGTKRSRRRRLIPRLVVPERPALAYKAFRQHLATATDGTVLPYDGRRSFAHWMELAGIPRSRRKMYHGHAGGDMLDLYERHEAERYLADDGAKLRALIGDEGPGLRLVKGGAA